MRGRHLLIAALLLLPIVPTAMADVAPPPPPRGTVWLVTNTIQAMVEDNYAIVKVIADIANRGPDPEFPFAVRLPADAFVSGLTITRDGQAFEAEIKPREQARQEYEDWKAQQQTGGLVERQRGTQVYAYLINVAEFTNVRAELTYERYLAADQGDYHLDLEAPVSGFGQDQGATFDVTIAHADGVLAAWSNPPSQDQGWRDGPVVDGAFPPLPDGAKHLFDQVGPRGPEDPATPFNVTYQLRPTRDEGSLVALIQDGQGSFAHRFRAPADARELPLDLVLVLDTSGSMTGLKIQQMQDAAVQVIGMLGPEDRLHLVLFSSDATSRWSGLRNATAELCTQAAQDVRAAFAAGGTNIEAGIARGFDAFEGIDWRHEDGRLPLLVFLTDGQPSTGLRDRAELREAAKDANDHGVNVFTLAFGSDADWSLVAGLAADGQGTALRVPEGEGAEVDLQRFMAALTTPVLKDVVIEYTDGVQAYRRTAPILFAGSELLVIGTFDPALDAIEGVVRAMAPDGPRSYAFRVDVADAAEGSFLPRLVASEEIRHFQERIDAEGARQDWADAIVELALRHGFVTDYTSLVVTLDPRELQRCMDCFMAEDTDWAGASGAPGAPAPMMSTGSGGSTDTRATTSSGGPAPPPAPAPSTSNQQQTTPTSPWTPGLDSSSNQEMAKHSSAKTPGFEVVAGLAALALVGLGARRKR
ncbi:MAG TPA: VIT and VWA domain-containing protein [Candidatus Thermoplasmatota archaeon]|jgi:PGF-CTERM protein|nr:VIT and VWA domain-containing protein [Candidatus Thermoplasmatota archaeon]